MKLTSSHRRNTPSEEVGDVFDIDVTPVMNMFVVLIPFLVSMAVFAQFSMHKFYLPSDAANTQNRSTGQVKLKTTVVLNPTHMLLTLGGESLDSVSFSDPEWDKKLRESLVAVRASSGDSTKAVVAVHDDVEFEEVVDIMDACREIGFEDVGLSETPPTKDSTEVDQ